MISVLCIQKNNQKLDLYIQKQIPFFYNWFLLRENLSAYSMYVFQPNPAWKHLSGWIPLFQYLVFRGFPHPCPKTNQAISVAWVQSSLPIQCIARTQAGQSFLQDCDVLLSRMLSFCSRLNMLQKTKENGCKSSKNYLPDVDYQIGKT